MCHKKEQIVFDKLEEEMKTNEQHEKEDDNN